MKKETLLSNADEAPEGQIHFVASRDFENINFFSSMGSNHDFSNLRVHINGELTNQAANSISASANDDVIIKAVRENYPWFNCLDVPNLDSSMQVDAENCIKSVEEPFPLMYNANGVPIDSFSYCFFNCNDLASIPENLFANNPQATKFYACFAYCYSLTSIPENLFTNNIQATDFGACFHGCAMESVPENLFANNVQATSFSLCFAYSAVSNLPKNLFKNNVNATDFSYCFEGAGVLESIPAGLFSNNTNARVFIRCFYNCAELKSIPEDLFNNNIQAIEFSYCFAACDKLLEQSVQIGSLDPSIKPNNVDYFNNNAIYTMIVYCRANSAAYNAFLNSTTANVHILTY